MKEWSASAAKRMEDYLDLLERLRLLEYTAFLNDPRRMLLQQLLMGMARGMGMAVGFTVLGALLVLILQHLAQQNLPIIGNFLADVVDFVQNRLETR